MHVVDRSGDYRNALVAMIRILRSDEPGPRGGDAIEAGLVDLCLELLRRYERLSTVTAHAGVAPLEHLELLLAMHDERWRRPTHSGKQVRGTEDPAGTPPA